MKKLYCIIAVGITLLVAGCSSKSASSTPNAQELISQSVAAQKSQNNVHAKVKMETSGAQMTGINIDADFNLKPIKMLGTYQMATMSRQFRMYLDKDSLFISQKNGEWQDLTGEMSQSGIDIQSLQEQMPEKQMNEVPKDLYKNARVSRQNGIYTIKAKANKNVAKKILQKGVSGLGKTNIGKLPENLKISKLAYTFKIDAKTKLPTQLNVSMVLEAGNEKLNENITSTYTNWGKTKVNKPTLSKVAN